jgi:MFS family permease
MILEDPVPAAAENAWWSYFFQTFYHASILPLLLLTVIFAWLARPSTSEAIPAGFRRFQLAYLSVWSICVCADWLQGPFVYALYEAYGFTRSEIAELFVAGFGASLVFGCLVGSVADRFGRKKTCVAYCIFYILSCMTKHFNNYSILMVGRITGGIATSMLFSCFECWLVAEHCQRFKFSQGLLSYMFGMMFTAMYCVAIFAGLAAQYVADSFTFHPISKGSVFYVGGYCGPFDMSIACLLGGMALILGLWKENYGDGDSEGDDSSMLEKLKDCGNLLRTDRNMLLLCVIVACFEGSMFAFVFNWTPALSSKTTPLPHGVVFSLFMMACMMGASVATIVGDALKPSIRLIAAFLLGFMCFGVSAYAGEAGILYVTFAAFLVFEFCVGLYFPSVGIVKSDCVPEHIRGTMYNVYRVPLNAVVVGLLLTDFSMTKVFMMCGALMSIALIAIMSMKLNNKGQAEKCEEASPLVTNKQV